MRRGSRLWCLGRFRRRRGRPVCRRIGSRLGNHTHGRRIRPATHGGGRSNLLAFRTARQAHAGKFSRLSRPGFRRAGRCLEFYNRENSRQSMRRYYRLSEVWRAFGDRLSKAPRARGCEGHAMRHWGRFVLRSSAEKRVVQITLSRNSNRMTEIIFSAYERIPLHSLARRRIPQAKEPMRTNMTVYRKINPPNGTAKNASAAQPKKYGDQAMRGTNTAATRSSR